MKKINLGEKLISTKENMGGRVFKNISFILERVFKDIGKSVKNKELIIKEQH